MNAGRTGALVIAHGVRAGGDAVEGGLCLLRIVVIHAGMFETALQAGEIITEVSFPVPVRAAYMKFRNPASRYAIVGVFVADLGSGVRVAVTGAAPCVFRVPAMEAALSARFAPQSIAAIKLPEQGLNPDMHSQADHRAQLVTVMAMRAVEAALG